MAKRNKGRRTEQAGLPADPPDGQWGALSRAPLAPRVWQALHALYGAPGLRYQRGYVAKQLLRLPGLGSTTALQADARQAAEIDNLLGGGVFKEAGHYLDLWNDWLRTHPADWLTWLYLARLSEKVHQQPHEQAMAQAVQHEPIAGESWHMMGLWRQAAGDAPGAVDALSRLLDVRPIRHGSMLFLGQALLQIGNRKAAEAAFARASLSQNVRTLRLLAQVAFNNNYWVEALDVLRNALRISQDEETYLQMARVQAQTYDISGCRESLSHIRMDGPLGETRRSQEADLIVKSGDAAGAYQSHLAAYRAQGDKNSREMSSVLMSSLYLTDMTAQDKAALHKDMCAHLDDLGKQFKFVPKASTSRSPKALRIGYVTGDLHRQHPVNIFMLPLLREQKKSSLEVFIYHTGSMYDEYTIAARDCADKWHECGTLDDGPLRDLIVEDGVDILIDLGGHTATHRLGVFAMRAAPVQMTFLGYPHSTGLSNIDYLIGDPVVSPDAAAALFAEKICQLPHTVFCWAPTDDYPLPPPRPPEAPVVFGSFNSLLKLSDATIQLWSRVLEAVPDAQLLIKAPPLSSAEVRARIQARFVACGIAPSRLILRGPSELGMMMQEYGDIDIALDPLTYNGGTTSLQALWMGVPLVTHLGDNFASRMGASFLTTLGDTDCIASDPDAYVRIAQTMAGNVREIRQSRAALRSRIAHSPLGDIEQYARDFESMLRGAVANTQP